MIKRELFIVRHAKSSWDLDDISDIDRPLNHRGIRNAYEMARRLKIDRRIPDVFVSSPANRAMHTATIFINVFEVSFERLKIDTRIYSHGVQEILEIIRSQPDEITKLMVFGHNPDVTGLINTFMKRPIVDVPTCTVVIFTFSCDSWKEVGKESLVNEFIDTPKKE